MFEAGGGPLRSSDRGAARRGGPDPGSRRGQRVRRPVRASLRAPAPAYAARADARGDRRHARGHGGRHLAERRGARDARLRPALRSSRSRSACGAGTSGPPTSWPRAARPRRSAATWRSTAARCGRRPRASPSAAASGSSFPTAQFDGTGPAAQTALDAATPAPVGRRFFVPGALGGAALHRRARHRRTVRRPVSPGSRRPDDHRRPRLRPRASTRPRAFTSACGRPARWPRASRRSSRTPSSTRDVTDGTRAAVVVSPNVRLVLPWVEPAISVFTNIGTPLQGANDRILGLSPRVHGGLRPEPRPSRAHEVGGAAGPTTLN